MNGAVQSVGRHYRVLLAAVLAVLIYSFICANVYIMLLALSFAASACLVLESTDFGSLDLPFYLHRAYLRRTRMITTISAAAVASVILGDVIGIW